MRARWFVIIVAGLATVSSGAARTSEDVCAHKTLEWRLFDGSQARVTLDYAPEELSRVRAGRQQTHGSCVRLGVRQVEPLLQAMRRSLRLQTETDLVEAIVALAQSITFELRQGPHAPLDTLDLWKGDCEDKSILAAALLAAAGYETVLLKFGRSKHMAIAAVLPKTGEWCLDIDGRRYTYIECTAYGWRPGRLPPDLSTETPSIIRIPPEAKPATQPTETGQAAPGHTPSHRG